MSAVDWPGHVTLKPECCAVEAQGAANNCLIMMRGWCWGVVELRSGPVCRRGSLARPRTKPGQHRKGLSALNLKFIASHSAQNHRHRHSSHVDVSYSARSLPPERVCYPLVCLTIPPVSSAAAPRPALPITPCPHPPTTTPEQPATPPLLPPECCLRRRHSTANSTSRHPHSFPFHTRSSAEKTSLERDHAERLSNGTAPTMNGKLPNGSSAVQSIANGRPVQPPTQGQGKGTSQDEASRDGNRGWSFDIDSPNNKPTEGRGTSGERPTRDDGYFASVFNNETETEDGRRTTHVKLGAMGSHDGTRDARRDPTSTRTNSSDLTKAQTQTAGDTGLQVPNSTYRVSSPPAFNHSTPATNPQPYRLQHRHTLEVPKVSSARARDLHAPHSSTDDVVSASGRFSPNTPTRRRASLSLARRATRSIHSDMHLEEVPQDEDAARWAEHIRQKRASKRKRREDEDDDRVVVGTKVDQNHVNWVTAYNMLTGIRFTVSRTNAKMDRELTDADFETKHKFSFDMWVDPPDPITQLLTSIRTGNELTPSAKYDFKFKDYAPWVFRHLRSTFRLDPADYLVSLTSKYILSELGSPGKSGSFFYFSRDYKYIIKTIHHAEHKFLRKILKDYYNHVQENPNTLLSQFYGLHRVKIPYGRKIHFVVMNNLFPPHRDIHRTFDMKGSTIGRDFKEEELESNPRATLKDLNWLRRGLHLEFGPTKKQIFIEQMQKDVKLLQKLKIMDYSLLIGIHDLERGNEENLRDKTLQVFQPGGEAAEEPTPNALIRTPSKLESARKAKELRQLIKTQKPVPMEQTSNKMPDELHDPKRNFYFYADDGGFRATHEDDQPGEEIYYLGIIDCLTHYSFIKRAEHFFKGLMNEESQISAIPPERYGDRFVKFISGVTKTREAAEREKAEEAENLVNDPALPGVNQTRNERESTEKVMERAEHQAERSRQRGASEDNVPNRQIHNVRSPSTERGELGTTLPVVEEAAESSSTGGRSGRSTDSNMGFPAPPLSHDNTRTLHPPSRDHSHGRPPPTPPKDSGTASEERPPTPPKDTSYVASRHSGPPTPPKEMRRERSRGREKELPMPPSMETIVRVN
ncbi:SAICAR synthase-like protein [Amniculicola lignicola CBS 123094]|uniref:1-phosphatidylinositol-4-phosphate 5-kinase n=1 Tax=Amniculicola lignicola CBS 123094 TaxID=1392246 RepID=A0A6A5X4D6_9PLEO|nr:SAICAR synthase-like protein [Amniculicola lignicola CBS 123094]